MELAYCVPRGIPHGEFLSWPADDQDKALAYLAAESERCSGCGTRSADWDPKQGGSRTAFVADITRCLGCEVKQQAERDLSKTPEENLGIRIGLVPNDEDDADELVGV
jgi:hypothetical protein